MLRGTLTDNPDHNKPRKVTFCLLNIYVKIGVLNMNSQYTDLTSWFTMVIMCGCAELLEVKIGKYSDAHTKYHICQATLHPDVARIKPHSTGLPVHPPHTQSLIHNLDLPINLTHMSCDCRRKGNPDRYEENGKSAHSKAPDMLAGRLTSLWGDSAVCSGRKPVILIYSSWWKHRFQLHKMWTAEWKQPI